MLGPHLTAHGLDPSWGRCCGQCRAASNAAREGPVLLWKPMLGRAGPAALEWLPLAC